MKRGIMITPIGIAEPLAGNKVRFLAVAQKLIELGWELDCVGLGLSGVEFDSLKSVGFIKLWNLKNTKAGLRKRRFLGIRKRVAKRISVKARAGIYDKIGDLIDPSWKSDVKKIAFNNEYNFVFVNYIVYSPLATLFPSGVNKVVDTHDVLADRNKKIFSEGVSTSFWHQLRKADERKWMRRLDSVIAITNDDSEIFSRYCEGTDVKISTVGHFSNAKEVPVLSGWENCVGFIGSDNAVNRVSVWRLVDKILPIVRKEIADCKAVIGGLICRSVSPSDDIELIWQTKNIVDFYKRCAVTVNPCPLSTGLKIKNLESISYGRAVVTTADGAKGLDQFIGNGLFIGGDDEEIASIVVGLLNDHKKRHVSSSLGVNLLLYYDEANAESLANAVANQHIKNSKA